MKYIILMILLFGKINACELCDLLIDKIEIYFECTIYQLNDLYEEDDRYAIIKDRLDTLIKIRDVYINHDTYIAREIYFNPLE